MTSHSVPQDALVKSQKIHRTLLRVRALPVFGIVLLILAAFMPFEASMKNSDWLRAPAVPFSGSPYTGSAISLPGRIEAEGVRRARAELARADLVLWLVAPDVTADDPPSAVEVPVWRVGTKADIALPSVEVDLTLSARTGAGADVLTSRLAVAAAHQVGPAPLLETVMV